MIQEAYVTGVAVMLPGETNACREHANPAWVEKEFKPDEILGKRGYSFKDRATLLALCTVQRTIEDAGLDPACFENRSDAAVVVSTNLGNLDTIHDAVQTLRIHGYKELNSIDTPKASSNVIASNIAIRHKLWGPNFTICNGSSSGTDAVYIAGTLIRSARARRVFVVGVESKNEVMEHLLQAEQGRWVTPGEAYRIADGAACLLLESRDAMLERGGTPYARVGRYFKGMNFAKDLVAGEHGLKSAVWYTPCRRLIGIEEAMEKTKRELAGLCADFRMIDLYDAIGDFYGAAGVVQCAFGCRPSTGGGRDDRPGTRMIMATSGGFGEDPLSTITFLME